MLNALTFAQEEDQIDVIKMKSFSNPLSRKEIGAIPWRSVHHQETLIIGFSGWPSGPRRNHEDQGKPE